MRNPAVETIKSIKFEDATFSYDGDSPVFEKLNLEIPIGSSVFVTGPTGSGQSTFLKLLAVILQPQSGKLLINGEDTTQMSFEEFLPFRRKIGYTFDFGGLFANRTLAENLSLPILYHAMMNGAQVDEMVAKLAEDFGFARQVNQRPAMVSGGLRKLVCVLRTLILNPELVVMDDPFTGLGLDSSRKLVRLIQEKRELGELKHVFLTSRDEVWPHWIGCDALYIEDGKFRFEERKAA